MKFCSELQVRDDWDIPYTIGLSDSELVTRLTICAMPLNQTVKFIIIRLTIYRDLRAMLGSRIIECICPRPP